jgi:hypothetical protein
MVFRARPVAPSSSSVVPPIDRHFQRLLYLPSRIRHRIIDRDIFVVQRGWRREMSKRRLTEEIIIGHLLGDDRKTVRVIARAIEDHRLRSRHSGLLSRLNASRRHRTCINAVSTTERERERERERETEAQGARKESFPSLVPLVI